MSEEILSGLDGQIIGGCELLREIGRGSNGVVYLAKQPVLEREVACKLLFPDRISEEGYVENFLREARSAAKFDHPNVVQALDVGVSDNGLYYFVMEYVDGRTLEHLRLYTPEKITIPLLLETSLQLCSALGYAWEKFHMIHGDVKPENLLLRNGDDRLKLADLGMARLGGASGEDVMLTPMYAAPEVIRMDGETADQRSDIYSFGAMLYELMCGRPPFVGELEVLLQRHLEEPAKPLLQRNPDADRELASLIDQMLEKNPDDRPASWRELEKSFTAIRDRLAPPPGMEINTQRNPALEKMVNAKKKLDGSSRMPLLFIAAGALLVIVLFLVLHFLLKG